MQPSTGSNDKRRAGTLLHRGLICSHQGAAMAVAHPTTGTERDGSRPNWRAEAKGIECEYPVGCDDPDTGASIAQRFRCR